MIELDRLRVFLEEDVPAGDVTSETLIPADMSSKAMITSGGDGVLAGAEEAAWLFADGGLKVTQLKQDGDPLAAGDEVMVVEGPLREILLRERVCLNIMMFMSGTATETSKVLSACRAVNPQVNVAATRKTLPGLRDLQKKAVRLGGGESHRESLSHHILVKDNHIQAVGGMENALRALREAPETIIEVEAETSEEALAAAAAGVDIILLDNMSPEEAGRCYRTIKESHPQVLVEISGGIGPVEAPSYAASADRISMGHLTHSAPSLQFSLHLH